MHKAHCSKRFFLVQFFLSFLLIQGIQANTKIDSLKAELLLAEHDTTIILLHNNIATEFATDYKLLDSSLYYAEKAMNLAKREEFALGKAQSAYNMGLAYDLKGKLKNALDNYELARQFYTEVGDKEWIANCMHGKGVALYFQGDYGRSMEYYLEALTFERENELLENEANTLFNIGVLYRKTDEYVKAVEIYYQTLQVRKALNDSSNIAMTYNNLGVAYTYMDSLDKAILYLDSCVYLFGVIQDTFHYAGARISLGDAHLEMGDIGKAKRNLLEGYSIMRNIDDNIQQANALMYLGKAEQMEKNFPQSKEYLEEALHILSDSELDLMKKEVHGLLAISNHSLGLDAAAYDNLMAFITLNDSIRSKERREYEKEVQVKFETQKKEQEIEQLNIASENDKRIRRILIIALSIFCLLVLGLIILYQNIRSQRNIISENLEEKEVLLDNLKRAQEKLIQSEKMASLGQLTAGIAHEINNPINFISSSTKAIQLNLEDMAPLFDQINALEANSSSKALAKIRDLGQKIDLPFLQKELSQLLKGINNGSERTADIIQSLTYFSHPGSNKKSEWVDIHLSLTVTVDILQNELRNIAEVERDFEKIPLIPAKPGQLNQVLLNIMTNAIDSIRSKYGEQDPPLGKISLSTGQTDTDIYIGIKDNGHGFTSAIKQKVFDPFFTTKDVGEGTGLGLSISYGLIENHGGRIETKGEEGEGAEFIIWLPKEEFMLTS